MASSHSLPFLVLLLLFSLLLLPFSTSHSCDGLHRLTKVYPRRLWSPPNTALDRLSCTFSPHQTIAILGPSGCGKSTLGKVLSGRETLSYGEILWHHPCPPPVAYLDDHFYMTYDPSRKIEESFRRDGKGGNLWKSLLLTLEEESLISRFQTWTSLLESQRRMTEICLGLLRAIEERRGIISSSSCPSVKEQQQEEEEEEGNEDDVYHCLLILDEYLDKDTSPIREKVGVFLKKLQKWTIQRVESDIKPPSLLPVSVTTTAMASSDRDENSSSIQSLSESERKISLEVQTFLLTHSKGVVTLCADEAIVLQSGMLYKSCSTDALRELKAKGGLDTLSPSGMTWIA
eukprot:scaffold1624_cov233-Ochromonas_danica.AAC.3